MKKLAITIYKWQIQHYPRLIYFIYDVAYRISGNSKTAKLFAIYTVPVAAIIAVLILAIYFDRKCMAPRRHFNNILFKFGGYTKTEKGLSSDVPVKKVKHKPKSFIKNGIFYFKPHEFSTFSSQQIQEFEAQVRRVRGLNIKYKRIHDTYYLFEIVNDVPEEIDAEDMHKQIKLNPLQAAIGSNGQKTIVLDFRQANGLKFLGTMGGGKSVGAETIIESLRRSTPELEICIMSLSGDTDFKRFKDKENYRFYNPSIDREAILDYVTKKNKEAQEKLKEMSENEVRHSLELKNSKPVCIFVDELESSFGTDKDAGEHKKINELIIGQLNEYLKVGRKCAHILIVASQSQNLAASSLALRLMHNTLLSKVQTGALCSELGIDDEMGRDTSLTKGKFILLGLSEPTIIRVARFK